MGKVETVLTWSIPGSVLVMLAVGGYELWRHRRSKREGAPVTATYVNEFTAIFYGTKRVELDHRDSMSLMRDEDPTGAPPDERVDLDKGTAVITPNDLPSPANPTPK